MVEFDFPVVEVQEGRAKLLVPDLSRYNHPAHAPVFFNPAMELNRDITVSVMKALKPRDMLDALAGTGAKGIRVMLEAGVEVAFNDRNPLAVKFIKENLSRNGLKARVYQKDANILMREESFHSIDIDPFGSPAPFVDSAANCLKNHGILGITATDTSALTGTYPRAGLRRYGVLVGRTSFMHELAIRALIGFVVREFAKYDIALRPIFSHSTLHYYRVFFKARYGKIRATKAMKELKWLVYDRKTEDRWYSDLQEKGFENYGPVWSKGLWDEDLLGKMEGVSGEAEKLISLAREESRFELPYIDYHILAGKYGLSLLKMDRLIEVLSEHGISASRSHFCGHCFKSDAQPSEIASVLESNG